MTTEILERTESHYFAGVFQVETSSLKIKSELSYIQKDGIVRLTSYTGNNAYTSDWKIKSNEKAINLLKRAEKDFKRNHANGGAPTLNSMEENYKNYFTEEVENYLAPWDIK